MDRSLSGRVVLVTGAARGIGEHTARLAARRGARVSLVGLEPDRLAALATDLGPEHAWFAADVTDQAALGAAVAQTVARFGGIDVVVANAGVANRGTIAIGDIEAMVRTVEVNLIGVMRTAAATAEALIERRGYLLIVSSAAAYAALPGMAAYCASKAGVEHFGNAIRLELAHRGVAVGTAHPSWIDTDLVRDAKEDLPAFAESLDRLPGPMARTVSVEACAAAFVRAIERRQRRVYVPRMVGAVAAVRSLLVGPLADRAIGRQARTSVPLMEEQVRNLGRGFGRTTALPDPPPGTDHRAGRAAGGAGDPG
ncbi:SDR family oxidoreductase [Micromonospora echinofusca]|uniref:SDR family NAD(P)-dependent oxidoreductase n=1 Tax=Micromonospora echinofusca TaxID=47858 RepID=A0ABS3W0W2_MICEH|nr:SDR family oxidoreductase [Micromonospora echinofusca]MBO4210313.1 SDR family NAD(P)-dependent oxidoreductase [Micromonospora echinofusca]